MTKTAKKSSRELGLEVGAMFGRHFFKVEHLHYGLWTNGLGVDVSNLPQAQEKYTQNLLSHIPQGVKTILDVGCGAGKNAKRLVDLGYTVDCVSPSAFLGERASALLGESSEVFITTYEELQTDKRYDIVMFSESFQYVKLEKAIEQTVRLLNDGGYLFICDIFKRDVQGKSGIGGGHKINKFFNCVDKAGLKKITDEDITEQTAPTIEILDDAMRNVAVPAIDTSLEFLRGRYPLVTKLLYWKYKKKLNEVREKYTSGKRGSEDFKHFKTYRLFLFKKN